MEPPKLECPLNANCRGGSNTRQHGGTLRTHWNRDRVLQRL